MKSSIKTAMCGVITALSVALLFFGGIMYAFVYIMPMVTSVFMIMLKKTLSLSSAVITYISTSILSLMLVPEKECVLMYVLFFGYYPIICHSLEKIKTVPLKWLAKLIVFNVSLTAVQLLLVFAFHIPFLSEGEGTAVITAFAVLMNILFVIYDFTIKMLWVLYEKKLESRIKKYLK